MFLVGGAAPRHLRRVGSLHAVRSTPLAPFGARIAQSPFSALTRGNARSGPVISPVFPHPGPRARAGRLRAARRVVAGLVRRLEASSTTRPRSWRASTRRTPRPRPGYASRSIPPRRRGDPPPGRPPGRSRSWTANVLAPGGPAPEPAGPPARLARERLVHRRGSSGRA